MSSLLTNIVPRETSGGMKLKLTLLAILLFHVNAWSKQKADLVLINGTIYTVDKQFSTHQAVVIDQGKVLKTGSNDEITTAYDATKTIDLHGKYVYPGFIDAHCHFTGFALDQYKADLTGTQSYPEVLDRLISYEKTNKLQWIYARGWDQNDWPVKEFPTKKELDSLFPDKPVILKRIDGHAILCNSKALKQAGINAKTTVKGGVIVLKNNEPTGILIDNAMHLIERIIPDLPEATCTAFLQTMQKTCFSNGLTLVVDCGLEAAQLQLLQKMYAARQLSIGMTALLSSDKITLAKYADHGPVYNGQLEISGIKIYADGALGSRGACLLQPYSDDIHNHGLLLTEPNDIFDIGRKALARNWQVCTHAIGDSANRVVLQLYAKLLQHTNDKRWRIEHAQVVHPADFTYFGKYNIVPSVQPTHAISDMPWVSERLGKSRLPEAYAYKQLLLQNGWIALGTDFPVEAINPVATFYTAVFRRDKEGRPEKGFLPANALSREEALKGMTIWAAKSVFREKQKGSLEPGKDADLVILDCDLLYDAPEKILKATPKGTILKGTIVYADGLE